MTVDKVTLTTPSRGEYAKTVRMTASALVSRMGMTYDDVDDVRIAAEEAFVYACDHTPEGGEVTIEFTVGDDEFQMLVHIADGRPLADEESERRAAYATFILQSVCDRFEMSSDETGPYLRIVKRAGQEPDDAAV